MICKRSPNEKVFPNKWCVPGGKVQKGDFENTKKDTNDHWFDILEKTLEREIREETGLEISDIGYVSNLALIRPNGFSNLIMSLHGKHVSGEVKLDKEELVDHAGVSLEEAKSYDLIENIYEQMEKVEKGLS